MAIKSLNWARISIYSNAKLRNGRGFPTILKEDEGEQINHTMVVAGNILKHLAGVFAIRSLFVVHPALFWQSGFQKL